MFYVGTFVLSNNFNILAMEKIDFNIYLLLRWGGRWAKCIFINKQKFESR